MKQKLLSKLSNWLKDISSDSPCGEDFVDSSYEYSALESNINQAEESSEWKKLKKETDGYLSKTKDIRLYVLYTRILIHTEKNPFIGLSKGLQLVHHGMDNYWNCLYPEVDNEDSEPFFDRNNALANFADYGSLVLPLTKKLTVLSIGLGNYTLEDLLILDGGGTLADKPPLKGLMPEEEEAYSEVLQYFKVALDITENIKKLYYEKTSEVFPEFNDHLLPMLQKGANLGDDSTSDVSNDSNTVVSAPVGSVAPQMQIQGMINSREDIIKALGLICDYYDKNEPSSPIPMMLERVSKMVDMNYREIFSEFQLGADSVLDKIFGQPEKK